MFQVAAVFLGVSVVARAVEKVLERSLEAQQPSSGTDSPAWSVDVVRPQRTEYVFDAVERHGVFANSSRATVKIERMVSREWSRSVTWNLGGRIEGTAGVDVKRLIEAKLQAALELQRTSEVSERCLSAEKIEVMVAPSSQVEIAVHWYREEKHGEIVVSGPSSSGVPEKLTVPYQAVVGMTSQVHTTDVPRKLYLAE
ncbi:hypothetical protein ACH4F6_22100 [Streptomyces sp. NPDC017936]|uniref:hypothetical protein n=1 Tax=Streptomyces sp. NPDC017936 TaxID=3365016 RepID=UPI0037899E2C